MVCVCAYAEQLVGLTNPGSGSILDRTQTLMRVQKHVKRAEITTRQRLTRIWSELSQALFNFLD